MNEIEMYPLLQKARDYISRNYAAVLVDKNKQQELKNYLGKYLYDTGYTVKGYGTEQLINRLYTEMAEYSLLTEPLNDDDVEEININGWEDVTLTHRDGHKDKTKEHFFSPVHATDVVKKLLHYSGEIIDNSKPVAQGNLPGNARVTASKYPIVDADVAMAASIRKLFPQGVTRESLLASKTITEEMMSFLEMCLRYGVSFVIAGRTGSGKTTLLNALLRSIPDEKRIFTIESGARELDLVKRDASGHIINNVVHTLAMESDADKKNVVTQSDLVAMALRFDPDIICVGEMRNEEAYAAVEASGTDHTVVSTVHGSGGEFAHQRIALLTKKDDSNKGEELGISIWQAAMAFPVIVYEHRLEDNSRKVMDITECIVHAKDNIEYRTLYQFRIDGNDYSDGKFRIIGEFVRENTPSEYLIKKLLRGGVPQSVLAKFTGKEVKQ